MYLFSIAEKLAQDTSSIALDGAKCARTIDRFSKCDLCIQVCPTSAIKFDKRIEFDDKKCVSCGGCLHPCPTGAFSGQDHAVDLFNCVPRLPDARALQLTCSVHPAPGAAPANVTSVIRSSGCLASFGPSVYLWLVAEGASQVVVRLDACASCQIGHARGQISSTVDTVRSILNARGQADRVIAIGETRTDFKEVPAYDAKEPPMSRRDLFRSVAAKAPQVATQVLPMIDTRPTKGKRPPLERRRLINVLKRFPSNGSSALPLATEPVQGVARKAANSKCNACGACARVCPTGALQFVAADSDFRLTYSVGACTDCGACLDVCRQKALTREGVPTLSEFIASEPVVLISGALKVCDKCGAKFAGPETAKLCTVCDFRAQNPFGSMKPEDLVLMRKQAQDAAAASKQQA